MSSDENQFEQFLNTTGDTAASFKKVNPSSPVQWVSLGGAILGSIAATFVLGVQVIIDGILSVPARAMDFLANLIYTPGSVFRYPGGKETVAPSGIIGTTQAGLSNLINTAWQSVSGLGWLAYPVFAGELLVIFWAILWAINFVREEVL